MPGTSVRGKRTPKMIPFNVLTDLPGVVGWWDASTLTGADGSAVQRLVDLSGRGQDLVQFTAAKQPAVKASGQNGLRTVNLGSSAYLTSTTFGAGGWQQPSGYAQPLTVIAVFKATTGLVGSVRTVVGGGGLNVAFGATKQELELFAGSTGARGAAAYNDAAWHSCIGVFGTTSGTLMVDGYLAGAAATQTHGTGTITPLTLGAISNGTSNLNGEIAELIICQTALSLAQMRAVSAYLAAKWGLPAVPPQSGVTWQDVTDSGGQAIRVFAPATLGASVPLVIFNHQQAGTTAITPGFWAYPLIHALVNAGCVVTVSNNHGTDSWSSDNAENDVTNARAWVAANLGTVSGTVMIGASMGGALSVIAAKDSKLSDLRGVYLIDPAVNLRWMYANAYAGSIATGFGLTAGTLSAASLAGATSISSSVSFPSGTPILIDPSGTNPEVVTTSGAPSGTGPFTIPVPALGFAHASGVVVSDYPSSKTSGKDPNLLTAGQLPSGIRWRGTASAADTLVSKSNNLDLLATTIAATSPLEWTELTHLGTHLDVDSVNPSDAVAFVKRCLGLS